MLTQAEADALITMQKYFYNPRIISLRPGTDETYELISADLDLWRGTIRLSKYKMQTRGRTTIVLVRLDIIGGRHTNPDGQKLEGAHIHIYREGFEDKWALPINLTVFRDISNIETTLENFCCFCHIEEIPSRQGVLL